MNLTILLTYVPPLPHSYYMERVAVDVVIEKGEVERKFCGEMSTSVASVVCLNESNVCIEEYDGGRGGA